MRNDQLFENKPLFGQGDLIHGEIVNKHLQINYQLVQHPLGMLLFTFPPVTMIPIN